MRKQDLNRNAESNKGNLFIIILISVATALIYVLNMNFSDNIFKNSILIIGLVLILYFNFFKGSKADNELNVNGVKNQNKKNYILMFVILFGGALFFFFCVERTQARIFRGVILLVFAIFILFRGFFDDFKNRLEDRNSNKRFKGAKKNEKITKR